MSSSSIIASNGKIENEFLPNPYPFPAQANSLAQVLLAGDDAGNQDIENLRQINTSIVAQQDALLGSYLSIGGLPNTPLVGGDLRIQGATTKGSILVGNGTSTKELPVGANGLVLKANSAQPYGVEWAVDGTGGITSVNSGTNVSVDNTNPLAPIVNLATPLTSNLEMGSVSLIDSNGVGGIAGEFLSCGAGGTTLWTSLPNTFLLGITAGDNIVVDNTNPQIPVVSVSNPFGFQETSGSDTTNLSLQSSNTGLESIIDVNYTNTATGQSIQGLMGADNSVGGIGGQMKVSWSDSTTFANLVEGQVLPTTATHEVKCSNSVLTGDYASTKITSQSNQTRTDVNVVETGSTLTSTRTDITTPQGIVDTHTALNTTSTNQSQRVETTDVLLGANQVLSHNDTPTYGVFTQTHTTNNTGCVYQATSEQLIGAGSNLVGTFSGSSTFTQGELGASFQNLTAGSLYTGTSGFISNAGGSTMTLTSADISVGNSHLLRCECPQAGNALVEHTSVGAVKDLTISTQGRLNMLSGTQGFLLQGNPILGGAVAGNIAGVLNMSGVNQIYASSIASSIAVPAYLFQNTNTNNANYPVIRVDRTSVASVANDTIGAVSFFADDAGGGVSREWSRIQTTATNVAVGNQDATLSFFASQNGNMIEALNINLGSADEINAFRSIDLNNNSLRTSSGDLSISASASSGNGVITLATKNGTGGLAITGDKTQSATAGGASGQHLVITLNGVVYKIALLNP